MNIVTFTRIWPNESQPTHGMFVEQRQLRVAARGDCEVRVVAPVPWYPPVPGPRKWTTYAGIPRKEAWRGLEVEHPRYPVIPKIGLRWQGGALARVATRLFERMDRASPIHVIDAHYLYPEGFAAVEAGQRLRIPTVLNAIGSDVYELPRFSGIGERTRAAIRGATMLLAVSQPIADSLAEMGAERDKIVLLPYGIDADRFAPKSAAAAQVRSRLGLGARERMILAVGRLHPMKGHDLLLESFARLAGDPNFRDVKVVIVGDGELRGEMESRVRALGLREKVVLAGAVPNAHLGDWYSAADLFCLPSRGEGHPNVLIEALACGTPVVATAVGAVPEVVRPTCGLVVPPENAEALAYGLRAGLAAVRDGLWTQSAAQASVAGRDWNQVAEEACAVFREAVRRGPAQAPVETRMADVRPAAQSR